LTSPARGYQLEDFVPLWEAHLSFDPADVTRAQQSEIANKDAGCNAVTDSGEVSISRAKTNGKAHSSRPDKPENEQIPLEKPWANGSCTVPLPHEVGIAALSAAS
jgi:hypothetical protein